MSNAYGGLYITGNTTNSIAPNTAAKHTQGWAAITSPSQHGNASVTPSASSSKLTLVPGVYEVTVELVVNTPATSESATSGDTYGTITAQLYKDGSAIAGTKSKVDLTTVDAENILSIHALVEVLSTDTGDIDVRLSSGDASGNDILVSEGRFFAVKLD